MLQDIPVSLYSKLQFAEFSARAQGCRTCIASRSESHQGRNLSGLLKRTCGAREHNSSAQRDTWKICRSLAMRQCNPANSFLECAQALRDAFENLLVGRENILSGKKEITCNKEEPVLPKRRGAHAKAL